MPVPASRKTRAIAGFLMLAERPVSRQRLCELFFDIPDDPRAALRWSLTKLRPLLDDAHQVRLRSERDTLQFDPAGTRVDALQLLALADSDLTTLPDDQLQLALNWSAEALMEDCELPERPEYTAWLTRQRLDLVAAQGRLLRALVERNDGNPAAQVAPLQHMIAADPLDEGNYSALVGALVALGRKADAEKLARQAARALAAHGLRPTASALASSVPRTIAPEPPQTESGRDGSGPPTVAVLPFADLSINPLPGHLLDGFFEGLVHALSRFRSLVTIAGQSTAQWRGTLNDPLDIAAKVGADILVSGSLMADRDGRLRLRWRAVDGRGASILAFGDINGHIDDVWDFQEKAAQRIAVEVEPSALAEAVRLRAARPTHSDTAYDLYLRGIFAGFSLSGRDYAAALDLFEQAIAIDPDFHPALAIAPWAAAYANRISGPADLMRYAEMSRNALRLGANDARTLATAGTALFYMAQEMESARQAIARAIEINPNEFTAWSCGGWMHAMRGEVEEAHRMFDQSDRLNPLAYGTNGRLAGRALASFLGGQPTDAERFVKLALSHDDNHPSVLMTGIATAATLGLESERAQRCAAFLAIYPEGLKSPSIRALPFDDPECRTRYFAAVRAGGVTG